MDKNLPKMYHNLINKEIDNSKKIYSTLDKNHNLVKEKPVLNVKTSDFNNRFLILQKINNIFNSCDFIYKADVTIVTKDNSFKKRIVGKNQDNLITIDGEYISISDIVDIYR